MDAKLSYASTPRTGEFYYKTHTDMLTHWANMYPEKEAFVEYDENGTRKVLTCKSTLMESTVFAQFLVIKGIKKGDIIVINMKNSLKLVISIFGVQLAGAIPTSFSSVMADGSDLMQIVEDTNAKLLIIDTELEDSRFERFRNQTECLPSCFLGVLYVNDKSNVMYFNVEDKSSTEIQQHVDEVPQMFPRVLPEDTAIYFTTSGSTGKPKLVEHCHTTWLNNSRYLNDVTMVDETSRYFCDRPLGWGVGSCRTFLASGATRIFVDTTTAQKQNRIDIIGEIIRQERCTHVYLPGYLVHDVVNDDGLESSFSSVITILTAGERITKNYQSLIGKFCKRLVVWYGSTELSGVSTYHSDDPADYIDGIIGKPMQGVEIKIVNDDGDVVPRGERGELLARSIYRFRGYLGMTEKFRETVDDNNWVHTDDVGFMNNDGNFVLESRKTEVISVGCTKLYPIDFEKVLMNFPEVAKAVVVPVPDERFLNAVCACIVLSGFATNICSNDIGSYFQKIWTDNTILKPKYYLIFEDFPSQQTGKFDRKSIAREAATRLKLN